MRADREKRSGIISAPPILIVRTVGRRCNTEGINDGKRWPSMKGTNNLNPPRVWSSCRAAVTEARLVSIESQVSIPGVRRIRVYPAAVRTRHIRYVRVYVPLVPLRVVSRIICRTLLRKRIHSR